MHIGVLRTASLIVLFSTSPEVIFKVKRSHFKVKFLNLANFCPLLSQWLLEELDIQSEIDIGIFEDVEFDSVIFNIITDPEIISLAPQEVIIAQELLKFRNVTLRYDPLILKMTSGAVENDNVELALLEVTLAQDSSESFRLKLQTPNIGGFCPSLKESMSISDASDTVVV